MSSNDFLLQLIRIKALVVFAISSVALLGYLFDAQPLYMPVGPTPMAVSTSFCLQILSLAVLMLTVDDLRMPRHAYMPHQTDTPAESPPPPGGPPPAA